MAAVVYEKQHHRHTHVYDCLPTQNPLNQSTSTRDGRTDLIQGS